MDPWTAHVAAGEVASATSRALARTRRIVDVFRANRLLQFVALGGITFALAPHPADDRSIAIRRDQQAVLYAAEARREGRARISDEKARDIDQRVIEDEILFREGLRLAIDKDDGVIRQRVVQKALFFAEELGGASRPATDAELRTFFGEHSERWKRPARVHFVHVFARDAAALPTDAEQPGARGAPSPIGPEMEADLTQIAAKLGPDFAGAVAALRPRTWSEPIRSALGWHRVKVLEHTAARAPSFEEVRASVEEQLAIHRRQEAVAAFLTHAFSHYNVEVDGRSVGDFVPSRRVAFRADASAED